MLTITQSDINNVSSLVMNLFDFPTLIEHTFDCGSASGKLCVADVLFLKFSCLQQGQFICQIIKLSKKRQSTDGWKDNEKREISFFNKYSQVKWSHVSCKENHYGGNDKLLVAMCLNGLFASTDDIVKVNLDANIAEDAFSNENVINMVNQAEPNNDNNAIEKSEGSHQEEIFNVGEKKSGNDGEVTIGEGQYAKADIQPVVDVLDEGVVDEVGINEGNQEKSHQFDNSSPTEEQSSDGRRRKYKENLSGGDEKNDKKAISNGKKVW